MTRQTYNRKTILFFISQCITLFGSQIAQMAIVWYVTLYTDSGAWVAAFSLCAYLPQFFVSFAGGALADRYPCKYLIIGADVFIALSTLATVLLLPHIGERNSLLITLLIMSVIRSIGAGIQTPAVNAVIPRLSANDELMRYNGINAAMQSLVQFLAPAVAGVILTASTLTTALMIDVLTAAVGVGLLACMKLPKPTAEKNDSAVQSDIKKGIHYAFHRKSVFHTLIYYSLFVFFTVPAGYLSGLLVTRLFGDTYWYLTAVELVGFGGMMAGGLLMSFWGGFKKHKFTLSAGLLVFGVMAGGMGFARSLILYFILMAIYGVALTTVQTTITTVLQLKAEETMHGRVFGLMSALYCVCYPAGMAIFGPLADKLPLQWSMIFSGAALAVTAAVCCFDKEL